MSAPAHPVRIPDDPGFDPADERRAATRTADKPIDLVFGVDDRPRFGTTVGLALQHLSVVAIFLIVPVTIAHAAGADDAAARSLISMSMIGAGIAVALQALGRAGIGSGYLVPSTASTIALPSAVAAVKAGGLDVLFGLVMVAGLVEAAASRVVARLRPFFPPELAGLVVLVVGLSVAVLAAERFLAAESAEPVKASTVIVACASLGTMVALAVWGRDRWRLFGPLLGLAVGYGCAALLGLFGAAEIRSIMAVPALAMPQLSMPRGIDLSSLAAFAIAGLAMALNSMGAVTAAQKINAAHWKRPGMTEIGGGLLAQGLANLATGALGGAPQAASSSNVGLSKAAGATSRHIAWTLAAMLVALGFLPQVAQVLLAMPEPVMGAMLMFSASFLVLSGMQMIASRMLDTRKTFVIGIALTFAMSHFAFPGHYAAVHPALGAWIGTPMAMAVTIAVLLNLLFRIAIHRRERAVIAADADAGKAMMEFMQAQGGLWGAPPAIVFRATYAATEIAEAVASHGLLSDFVPAYVPKDWPRPLHLEVQTKFDEFTFEVGIRYRGRSIRLSDVQPTPDEIIEAEDGLARLAGYMIKKSVDHIEVREREGITQVTFAVDN
ncbi:MAG: solute carrier family 23 protein [Alphaproteobacteria bacterium]